MKTNEDQAVIFMEDLLYQVFPLMLLFYSCLRWWVIC